MEFANKVLNLLKNHSFHFTPTLFTNAVQKLSRINPRDPQDTREVLEDLFEILGSKEIVLVPGCKRHSFFNFHDTAHDGVGRQTELEVVYPFIVRDGYVAIVGELEYNDFLKNAALKHQGEIAEMIVKGTRNWVVDISKFLGGSDGVACIFLYSFFQNDKLGFYVGKDWVTTVFLQDKLLEYSSKVSQERLTNSDKVTVLISQDTSSAGEFTASYLKTSSPNVVLTSIDGANHTDGRLSVNYSETVDDTASPFFVTAYYTPIIPDEVLLDDERKVLWNRDRFRITYVVESSEKVYTKRIAPWVVADRVVDW